MVAVPESVRELRKESYLLHLSWSLCNIGRLYLHNVGRLHMHNIGRLYLRNIETTYACPYRHSQKFVLCTLGTSLSFSFSLSLSIYIYIDRSTYLPINYFLLIIPCLISA